MNIRTTFVVLLVAIALATYFIVFELNPRNGDATDPTARIVDKAGEPLFGKAVDSTEIQSLTIQMADESPVVLERVSGDTERWHQTKPVSWPAQAWKLDSIADAVATLRYTRQLDDDADPADYGLSPTKAVITLKGKDFEHVIRLGRTAAAGKAFVAIDDSPVVYVVGDGLHDAIKRFSPADYRETSLATIPLPQVNRVTLNRDGSETSIVRKEGQWAFEGQSAGRVNADVVEALVGTISFAEVKTFVADNPEDLVPFGLADPSHELTVKTSADAMYTLRIGRPRDLAGNEFFAMWNDAPVVFTLAKAQVDRLAKSVDDLRDPHITNVARSDIREITIQRPDEDELHFVLTEGVWSLKDVGFDVELGAVSDLIDQLLQAKADRYQADFGDKRFATVRLAVAGQSDDEVLRFAQGPEANQLLVRRADETTSYVIESAQVSRLPQQALAFRDRSVIDVPAASVMSVIVQGPGERKRTVSRDDQGRWELAGLDREVFENLLARATRLRASSWVEADRPETDATLTLVLQNGEQRVVHLATERLLGWTDAGVFMLHAGVMDALTDDLRDRTVVKFGVDQISSVELGPVTIERYDGGRYRRADGEMIDEENAGQLFDTIAGLKAVQFVDVVGAQPTLTVTINTADGSTGLSLWALDEGRVVAQVGDGAAFTIVPAIGQSIISLANGLANP